MKKILFVCLGNICRSPMAETIMNDLLEKNGMETNYSCDSAGTAGWHYGDKADRRMRKYANDRGYRITHLARQISLNDFDRFDIIVGMDNQNIADLKSLARRGGKDAEKIVKISDFFDKYKMNLVPDPYYGDREDFLLVIDLLEDACGGLLKELQKG